MSNLFFDNVKIHATKEALYDILKEEYINLGYDVNELETIYEYAKEVYSGIYRYSSDEYITHPLNVAIILVYMEKLIGWCFLWVAQSKMLRELAVFR